MKYLYGLIFLITLCFIDIKQGYADPALETQMTAGILRWKLDDAHGRWWSCGRQYGEPDIEAQAWAQAIVAAAGTDLDPWGIAGIIANESKFDPCAMGKRTREWAYQKKLLKPHRMTISHTKQDVLKVLARLKKLKKVHAVDLGPGQLMYGTVYRGSVEELLTITPGVALIAQEIRRRQVAVAIYDKRVLQRPWAIWPGRYDEKYAQRIERLMDQLKQ